MANGDFHYWWEGTPEAQQAYCRVCAQGWFNTSAEVGPDDLPEYNIDQLFLLYYTVLSAIKGYIAGHPYLWEPPDDKEVGQVHIGGPQ